MCHATLGEFNLHVTEGTKGTDGGVNLAYFCLSNACTIYCSPVRAG